MKKDCEKRLNLFESFFENLKLIFLNGSYLKMVENQKYRDTRTDKKYKDPRTGQNIMLGSTDRSEYGDPRIG